MRPTQEYKEKAVAEAAQHGISEAAETYKVTPGTLYRWQKKFGNKGNGKTHPIDFNVGQQAQAKATDQSDAWNKLFSQMRDVIFEQTLEIRALKNTPRNN